MTDSFVNTLRAAPQTVSMSGAGADALQIRVQVADVWDAIRMEVSPGESVGAVKRRALEELSPVAYPVDEYVVKLRGIEILDEGLAISACDVRNGSTLILVDRRRRPVR